MIWFEIRDNPEILSYKMSSRTILNSRFFKISLIKR